MKSLVAKGGVYQGRGSAGSSYLARTDHSASPLDSTDVLYYITHGPILSVSRGGVMLLGWDGMERVHTNHLTLDYSDT